MIPGSANPLLLASAAAAGGYQISRSLRFNSSDSAFCSRTPAVAGDRKKWTWSGWVKRGALDGNRQVLFGTGDSGLYNSFEVEFITSDVLRISDTGESGGGIDLQTTQVFRDCSAWGHLLVSLDTAQTTASDRVNIYWNGVKITTFSTANYPGLSTTCLFNTTAAHGIGRAGVFNAQYLSGYLADIHFIDGQALTPSSFTEVSATTGQLEPKAYTGSYNVGSGAVNGFHLDFADNSAATAAALGKDTSGNGNNWTPNNLSVTAGAGNDSLVDSPTSYGTDTYVGGEVRGNYCTWNPLGTAGPASSNGNLDIASSSTAGNKIGTILLTSGKWYWECVGDGYAGGVVGVGGEGFTGSTSSAGSKAIGYWFSGGIYWDGGSFTSGIASYTTSDVIGIAVDMTAGTVAFYKNNSLVYTATFGSGTVPNLSSGVYPGFNTGNPGGSARTVVANFGQRAFAHPAPSGFKALCTQNLPAPVVAKPNTVMDVALWTANGSSQSITGLGFQPDLVWAKSRNTGVTPHLLVDSVRGVNQVLYSHSTDFEQNYSTIGGCISAFNSDGFATGGNSDIATNNRTFVAWAWDAGTGSPVSNPDGSITSQVRANASAGFSIVTFTGNASTSATVGHGLGVAPRLIIEKSRTASFDGSWWVHHANMGSGTLRLNSTDAVRTDFPSGWINNSPTSTTFSFTAGSGGTVNNVNYSGDAYVAYCFAPVVGYSNAFTYSGNGSSDGPFTFLGFRPRLILLKVSNTTGPWYLFDTARNTYNVMNNRLEANSSSAEASDRNVIDALSNGFKLRDVDAVWNQSGNTYIGFAWAEAPFAYARAR